MKKFSSFLFCVLAAASVCRADDPWAFSVPEPPYIHGTPAAGDGQLVGGIDYLAENDFHVACWDEERNFFVNPSFESGLKFVDIPRYRDRDAELITSPVHSGKYAFCPAGDFVIRGITLLPNTNYCFSVWMKSLGKEYRYGAGHYFQFFDRDGNNLGSANFNVTYANGTCLDWRRKSFVVKTKANTQEVYVKVVSSLTDDRGERCLIALDDFQLTLGGTLKEYEGTPYGAVLDTGSADNLYVDANRTGGHVDVLFRGPSGATLPFALRIKDALGRDLGTRSGSVTFGASGESAYRLGDDADFPFGMIGIEITFFPGETGEYRDFLRFARFPYQDNTRAHRNLQTDKEGSPFAWESCPSVVFSRDRALGLGAINYTARMTAPLLARLASYGIEDWYGAILNAATCPNTSSTCPICGGLSQATQMSSFTAEYLHFVETNVQQVASQFPGHTFWTFQTEPEGNFQCLKDGHRDEMAKLLLAVNRGLKAANSANEFCPFGDWTMQAAGRNR